MNITSLFVAIAITGSIFLITCQSKGVKKEIPPVDITELTKNQTEKHGQEVKEGDIAFTTPLDEAMAKRGNEIYSLKCQSCHRLNDIKLVGPGWKGVTTRRSPNWIINMITNVDMMLEKDAEAQKLLELCLVRMPNQDLSSAQARDVIEFMRKNDGVK